MLMALKLQSAAIVTSSCVLFKMALVCVAVSCIVGGARHVVSIFDAGDGISTANSTRQAYAGMAARAGITGITCIISIQFTKLWHADFAKTSEPYYKHT